MAWLHQAWTHFDVSLKLIHGIHTQRASQGMIITLLCNICHRLHFLNHCHRLLPHNPKASWLTTMFMYSILFAAMVHGPLARFVKLRVAHARERFPGHRGLAIPTCITARAWHMCRDSCLGRWLSVYFEVGGGENVSGIPEACATAILRIERGPWHNVVHWVALWRPYKKTLWLDLQHHSRLWHFADGMNASAALNARFFYIYNTLVETKHFISSLVMLSADNNKINSHQEGR